MEIQNEDNEDLYFQVDISLLNNTLHICNKEKAYWEEEETLTFESNQKAREQYKQLIENKLGDDYIIIERILTDKDGSWDDEQKVLENEESEELKNAKELIRRKQIKPFNCFEDEIYMDSDDKYIKIVQDACHLTIYFGHLSKDYFDKVEKKAIKGLKETKLLALKLKDDYMRKGYCFNFADPENDATDERKIAMDTKIREILFRPPETAGKKTNATPKATVVKSTAKTVTKPVAVKTPPAKKGKAGKEVLIYMTFQAGTSDKFYELIHKDCIVNVRYGRTGTNGVSDVKTFGTATEAQKFVDKMVREKTNKGYV